MPRAGHQKALLQYLTRGAGVSAHINENTAQLFICSNLVAPLIINRAAHHILLRAHIAV